MIYNCSNQYHTEEDGFPLGPGSSQGFFLIELREFFLTIVACGLFVMELNLHFLYLNFCTAAFCTKSTVNCCINKKCFIKLCHLYSSQNSVSLTQNNEEVSHDYGFILQKFHIRYW